VDLITEMGFDIIKIASCSFTDWPLLNKIANDTNLPIIASVAGSSLDDIDRVVSFFSHRNKDLTLLHCVGEYPTEKEHAQLNQIDLLKHRYAGIKIGWSTHESPDDTVTAALALSKGAEVVEKHVGITNLNAYSIDPLRMTKWLEACANALLTCGVVGERSSPSNKELSDLAQFRRGAFLTRDILENQVITRNDVYYAWPASKDGVLANDMSKYVKITASIPMVKDEAILKCNVVIENEREKVWNIVQKVKQYLIESKVVFPGKAHLEVSHHYGLDRFFETGITMLTVINRDYCKKLIVALPGQSHPEQYHLQKEETFMILHGEVDLVIDNVIHHLKKGDVWTIERKQRHSFVTKTGVVVEELSSTHFVNDSFYTDPNISQNKDRKTLVNYWM
jgi:mannose-6-phosphate isomerase-like protein (cupin superfamily)